MDEIPPDLETSQRIATQHFNALFRALPPRLAKLEAKAVSRAKDGTKSLFDRLEQLYRSVDEVFGFVSRYTPCKRGCSGCCFYNVDLFGIEVAYLERMLGIQSSPSPLPIMETHGLPCPFLSNGECSIYQHRPFACRANVTLDRSSYWCHHSRANSANLALVRCSEFLKAIMMLSTEFGDAKFVDIRNVFSAARMPN